MKKNLEKYLSIIMIVLLLTPCLGQLAYATESEQLSEQSEIINQEETIEYIQEDEKVDAEVIETVLDKDDFIVTSDMNQDEHILDVYVNKSEDLDDDNIRIEDIYALLSEDKEGAVFETYKLGYNENDEYYLEIDINDLKVSSLYIQLAVNYICVDKDEIYETNISECCKVDNDVAINNPESEQLLLDEVAFELLNSDLESEVDDEEDAASAGKTEDESENKTVEDGVTSQAIDPETENSEVTAYAAPGATELANNMVVVNTDGNQKIYHFTLNVSGYSDVKVAVWSEKDGQDDLRWYIAKKETDNKYTVDVEIKNHASTGLYFAHAYGTDLKGKLSYITGSRFTIDAPVQGKAVTESTEAGFRVTLSGVSSPSGIKQMEAAVWCNSNQSDLVWKQVEGKDGKYVLDVDTVEHGILEGKYTVHFYAVDGNGFKSFCGGVSRNVESKQNKLYIQNTDRQQKKYYLGLNTSEYTNVRYAVWSGINGQDDLKWYVGQKNGNNYIASFDIKSHGSTGIYYVHVYGNKNGQLTYITGQTFMVEAPSNGTFSVKQTDTGFHVSFGNISSPSGIDKVEVAVWCSDNQSDLIWQSPGLNKGNYELDVNIADHKMMTGTYIVHAYAVDGNGIKSYCGGVRYNVSISASNMSANITEKTCDIEVSNVSYSAGYTMSIAVWSKNNGQDDLIWYDAIKSGNNYKVSIPMDNLKDSGTYYAHAYVSDTSGRKTFVKAVSFVIDYVVSINEISNGQIPVKISKVNPEKKFVKFTAEIWTKTDSSDVVTSSSVKSSDGTYSITIPIVQFDLYSGDYHVRIYGEKSNGSHELLKEVTETIKFSTGNVSGPDISSNKAIYTVTLKNVDLKGVEKSIRFAVWSEINGQDDLNWYTASKSGNNYYVDIPMYSYKDTGVYIVHIYATLQDGRQIYLNGTRFQVTEIVQSAIEVRNIDNKSGTAQIVEQIGNLGYDITELRVGIWNADANGNTIWYNMKASAGEYIATFDISKHNFKSGKYTAHVYATDTSGTYRYINGISFTMKPDNLVIYQRTDGANGKVSIYGANVNGTSVTSIRMATWSTAGAQDDLKWIDAKKDSTGGYYVNITRDDYKRSGEYTTHIYGNINGKLYYLGGTVYSVYKTGEFDEYAQEIMHNIIFAVETGGQVYGKAQYDCFAPAYNISEKETAITIGAGGWFATEARKLLKQIREENPTLFTALDKQGISEDIDNADWTIYGSDGKGNVTIARGSAKAKCIQTLISTSTGISVQNKLVDQEMIKYVNEAKSLGVTDLKGQMFLANIRHLGGYTPMKWVVDCCKADNLSLTMKNLYTSMRNHTDNKAGNGVGADKYNSRHVKVMGWLDIYVM